jgi:L,D-transpeptidase catalytic domain
MSLLHERKHMWWTIAALMIFAMLELMFLILLELGLTPAAFVHILKHETVVTSPEPAPVASTTDAFLHDEEVVTLQDKTTVLPIEKVLFDYVVVKDSCGVHFEGACVQARSGPGSEYKSLYQLRNDVVLKVGGQVERDGKVWYKIAFDEWLRYPERLKGDWYVSAEFVDVLKDEGVKTVWEDGKASTTNKSIVVDRSEQKLYAYDGEVLFKEVSISTGLQLTPTPRGVFSIYKKMPSRYMQGPLPDLADQQVYDLPGVPWNLYFTQGGAAIHGAYWHNSFGQPYSHGCVNLPPKEAKEIYDWAVLGTKVIVRD